MANTTKIVIIGYGRFGSLMYHILQKYWFKIYNTDLDICVVSSRKLEGVNQQALGDALQNADIIIPSVPISQFDKQMDEIVELLPKDSRAVMVDVCSVKIFPERVMRSKLPENTGIICTHPMWGPDSSENGTKLADLKFIYKYIRDNGNEKGTLFVEFWRALGQNMIEMTPEEHDKQAAYTHAYAFLIGKLGINLKVRRNQISTKGFEGILYNQMAVENDSGQLFNDMFKYNPFAIEMFDEFIEQSKLIYSKLYNETK